MPKSHHDKLCEMLREYSTILNGSLVEIHSTEHRVNLLLVARSMPKPPYRAGAKAREQKKYQVNKTPHAGVIMPAQKPGHLQMYWF